MHCLAMNISLLSRLLCYNGYPAFLFDFFDLTIFWKREASGCFRCRKLVKFFTRVKGKDCFNVFASDFVGLESDIESKELILSFHMMH